MRKIKPKKKIKLLEHKRGGGGDETYESRETAQSETLARAIRLHVP